MIWTWISALLIAGVHSMHLRTSMEEQADVETNRTVTGIQLLLQDSSTVLDALEVVSNVHAAPVVTSHSGVVDIPPWTYPLTAFVLTGILTFIFGSRGPQVVICVLGYLGALATMKISVKLLFNDYDFRFPKFLTALHFAVCAVVTLGLLAQRQWRDGKPFPRPSAQSFWVMIFPTAVAGVLSVAANNIALLHVGVAFVEVVASTNCLITSVLGVYMGIPFNIWLLPPLMLVVSGAACSISGDVSFSILGLGLCLSANVFRSVKSILQQKVMTGDPADRLDPVTMLFWVSPPSIVVMTVGSIATEGLDPYRAFANTKPGELKGLLLAILFTCVNAIALNLAQLFVTKDLGAVGAQLVSQSKTVLVVLGGAVLVQEPVTRMQILGFIAVMSGVYLFARMEQINKDGQSKQSKDPDLRLVLSTQIPGDKTPRSAA